MHQNKWYKLPFVVTVIGLLLFNACTEKNQTGATRQILSLPVVEVPTKSLTGYNAYPASLEGTINSAVRAKVAGYITEVLVDEGQAVKKGQVLFRLETQALNEDAGAAKANVNAVQVEVDKLTPLVEKGIIGEVQLQTAKARLAQAEASYNSIAASIGYATIKSPINGNVGSIPFRQGALVSPSDPIPLTNVSQVNEVYAFFSLNERDYLNMLQVTKGETMEEKITNMPEVELELVNGEIYPLKGKVVTITGQVNPTTGTVNFRATFPNPGRLLSNGNSGRIRVPQPFDNVVVVPEVSTFEQQGISYVYKVQGDSLAVLTSITVKERINNLVIVSSGLNAGERIVYEGTGKLRDKTPIKPQLVPFDSIAQTLKVAFK